MRVVVATMTIDDRWREPYAKWKVEVSRETGGGGQRGDQQLYENVLYESLDCHRNPEDLTVLATAYALASPYVYHSGASGLHASD